MMGPRAPSGSSGGVQKSFNRFGGATVRRKAIEMMIKSAQSCQAEVCHDGDVGGRKPGNSRLVANTYSFSRQDSNASCTSSVSNASSSSDEDDMPRELSSLPSLRVPIYSFASFSRIAGIGKTAEDMIRESASQLTHLHDWGLTMWEHLTTPKPAPGR